IESDRGRVANDGYSVSGWFDIEAKRPRDPLAIGRIGAKTIGDVALLDVQARIAHRAGCVLEQRLLLRRRHQAEQIARLFPVIVVGVMVVVGRLAFNGQRRLGEVGVAVPQPGAVRVEAGGAAEIAVDPHLPVAVVAHDRAFRRVDRDLVEVDAEAVTNRVVVREQARLQHPIRREANAGDDGYWRQPAGWWDRQNASPRRSPTASSGRLTPGGRSCWRGCVGSWEAWCRACGRGCASPMRASSPATPMPRNRLSACSSRPPKLFGKARA